MFYTFEITILWKLKLHWEIGEKAKAVLKLSYNLRPEL